MYTNRIVTHCVKPIIRRMLISIILLLLLFSCNGCSLIPKEEEVLAPPLKIPQQINYDFTELKKNTFENKLQVSGYVISASQKDISYTSQSGRLKSIYVKIGDKIKKGQLLADMVTDDLDNQIAIQEIYLKKVQMIYDNAVAGEDIKSKIEQAKLDVDIEQIKLSALNKKLVGSKLIAPINGTVDYIINAKSGDYIDSYSTIVRIADPNDLQIEYSGEKANDFELGMKVMVKIDRENFEGKIIMTPADMPVDADEKTKKSIRINVDKFPKETEIGDFADITLMLTKKDNVLVIKKRLIHNIGARKFVNILENGIKKERDIETGDENQTEVIIVKGLSEGEKLLKD